VYESSSYSTESFHSFRIENDIEVENLCVKQDADGLNEL